MLFKSKRGWWLVSVPKKEGKVCVCVCVCVCVRGWGAREAGGRVGGGGGAGGGETQEGHDSWYRKVGNQGRMVSEAGEKAEGGSTWQKPLHSLIQDWALAKTSFWSHVT